MNFNKIVELCEVNKISLPELASKIGASKPGLYRAIENKSMKVDTLEKIAKALNVSITQFFDDVMTNWEHHNEEQRAEISRFREENEKLQAEIRIIEILQARLETCKKEIEIYGLQIEKLENTQMHFRTFHTLFEQNKDLLKTSNLTKEESKMKDLLISYSNYIKSVFKLNQTLQDEVNNETPETLIGTIQTIVKANELLDSVKKHSNISNDHQTDNK